MLAGLNSITALLRLYKIRDEIYLQALDKPAQPDFVKAVVELYTDILEYQAKLILYFSQGSIKRGIRSTFKEHDWISMLEKVKHSDETCMKHAALFDKGKEHQFYVEQSSQIKQSVEFQRHFFEMFEAFQEEIQRDRQDDKQRGSVASDSSFGL